jgi:uncharacterized coiled-coil DUF342 family protein
MSIYLELSQEYEKDVLSIKEEIKTFEDIFKTRKGEIKDNSKKVLKLLYAERDENDRQAKHYRKIHNSTQADKSVINWR